MLPSPIVMPVRLCCPASAVRLLRNLRRILASAKLDEARLAYARACSWLMPRARHCRSIRARVHEAAALSACSVVNLECAM